MVTIRCKMCGGDIEVNEEKTFGTCEYCGSVMTLPKVSDDQRAARFNRGNHFRRQGEFDKALGVYESIVREDDADAEAHWCCALCRFGIEYVEDPNTFEFIPTCHRASFDSFTEDVDYLAALENSDGITKRQYQKDAVKIAEVQRGILATSQNEEPFDVFICYKETDDSTKERTRDSLDAQDIYYQLTQEGYRVFFSRITLEDKVGTEYEPYIFAALNSAKVMIAIGSKPEYFNAVWVKNEWSRFLAMMRKDRSKLLLPCYKGMDPYDLPEQLGVLQSYDMAKIGFMQDLIRGVKKVLGKDESKAQPQPQTAAVNAGANDTAPLLKRMFMYLEDGEWEKADEYADRILDKDPENAEAYLGKLMADLKVRRREGLKNCNQPFDDNKNYEKATRFADDKLKNELVEYAKIVNDIVNERKAEEKKRKEEEERKEKERIENEYQLLVTIHESKREVSRFNDELNELNKSINKYDNAVKSENNLKRERELLTARKAEFENELSGLGRLAFSRKKAINTELERITNRVAKIDKTLSKVKGEIRATDINKLHTEQKKAENELSQARADLNEAENELWQVAPEEQNVECGIKRGDILFLNDRYVDSDGELGGGGAMLPLPRFIDYKRIHIVVIPESVTSIDGSFEYCKELRNVFIPDSVTKIGEDAFYSCEKLRSITIPNSVKSIGEQAFCNCNSLTSISISGSVTIIGDKAFLGYFGNRLMSITVAPENRFYDSRNNCNALIETATNKLLKGSNTTVIPDGVTKIDEDAFYGCKSLTSVSIPGSVISIGESAFHDCGGLESIKVDPANKKYDSRNNCNAIIETETNTLLLGSNNTVIPDGITKIEESAFYGCKSLTSVSIPGSVTSIGCQAFTGCGGLESIKVDPANKKYDSRNNCNAIIETETNILLVGSNNTVIPDDVKQIQGSAFRGCNKIPEEIREKILAIEPNAFY